MKKKSIKILLLGDPSVGKTSLKIRFESGEFPLQYIPTVFNSYADELVVENISFQILIFDTNGNEDYDRIRHLSYLGTDVALLCFSLVSRETFYHIKTKWIKEIRQYQPKSHCILVGLKSDLKRDFALNQDQLNSNGEASNEIKDLTPISTSEIEQMKDDINADYFFESSSLAGIKVTEIFETACKIMIHNYHEVKKKRSKCIIS